MTLLSLPLLLSLHSLIAYPTCIAFAAIVGFGAYTWHLLGNHREVLKCSLHIWPMIRHQFTAAATEGAASAYSSSVVAIVGIVAPVGQVAIYSSGDRIYRMALLAVTAVSNGLQGWVSETSQYGAARRIRQALVGHSVLGGVGAAIIWLAGPRASALLFGSRLAVSHITAASLAIAFLAVSINTSIGRHALVPASRNGSVLFSTLAGAAVGLPAIAVGAHEWGTAGAAAGLALSEVVVLLCQLPAGLPILQGRGSDTGRLP